MTAKSNEYVQAVRKYAAEQKSEVFVICAEIEEEISELDDDEKKMFLEDLGLKESGLEKLVRASYSLLGLMSFLTSGDRMRHVHGRSRLAQKLLRQPERSIQILSVDLSRQKLLTIKIFLTVVPMQEQEKRVLSAWKEKNTLFRMEM